MDVIAQLMNGAIDLHVHASPSLFPRSLDQIEAARQAEKEGLRAIVIKDHHHSSAPEIEMLRKHDLADLNVEVFGSVALNSYTGGLNPYIVDMTIRMGGRVIWFPTISSENHIKHHETNFPSQEQRALPEVPVKVLDENGEVVQAARDILGLIAEADVIMSPGHACAVEALALVKAATEAGVKRIVVNHPEFMMEATDDQMLEMTRLGAYIEHSICMFPGLFPLADLIHWIDLVGAEKTVLGSDLGQRNFPFPVDGMKVIIGQLLELGVTASQIELMIKKNPAWLLRLEE